MPVSPQRHCPFPSKSLMPPSAASAASRCACEPRAPRQDIKSHLARRLRHSVRSPSSTASWASASAWANAPCRASTFARTDLQIGSTVRSSSAGVCRRGLQSSAAPLVLAPCDRAPRPVPRPVSRTCSGRPLASTRRMPPTRACSAAALSPASSVDIGEDGAHTIRRAMPRGRGRSRSPPRAPRSGRAGLDVSRHRLDPPRKTRHVRLAELFGPRLARESSARAIASGAGVGP